MSRESSFVGKCRACKKPLQFNAEVAERCEPEYQRTRSAQTEATLAMVSIIVVPKSGETFTVYCPPKNCLNVARGMSAMPLRCLLVWSAAQDAVSEPWEYFP